MSYDPIEAMLDVDQLISMWKYQILPEIARTSPTSSVE
jgi:hypothetical protein